MLRVVPPFYPSWSIDSQAALRHLLASKQWICGYEQL